MKNEIPSASARAGRLREAAQRLTSLPVDSLPSQDLYDSIVGDLPSDAEAQLKTLARGALDRGRLAAEEGEAEEAEKAFREAVLLWPLDQAWAGAVAQALRTSALEPPPLRALAAALDRRLKRRRSRPSGSSSPPWPLWIGLGVTLALGGILAAAFFVWGPAWNLGAPPARTLGPRTLETSFDTNGIRADIQVVKSRLEIFSEATVAELSAWVVFPDHRVDVWEGTVSALDANGQVLGGRDVVFHPSKDGPLEAGQGLEVFQQFDAWPWFDKIQGFRVSTSRILAAEAHPQDLQPQAIEGLGDLGSGYNLQAWVQSSTWSDRFAAKTHDLVLDLENTGLKPFQKLEFQLLWKDPSGAVLKTVNLRPVSAFRTSLPPGGRLAVRQQTVFDTEVFSWPAGGEPHPVLVLGAWK